MRVRSKSWIDMTERTIAVIGGTGEQGFGITLRLAKAGEKIIIGSRQEQKAMDAAKRVNAILGANASVVGMENSKATACVRHNYYDCTILGSRGDYQVDSGERNS